jgi:hypothetical protein
MDKVMDTGWQGVSAARASNPAYRGYQILHWGFVALPTIAGIDKFTHLLANWDQYLAPAIAKHLPFSAHVFMLLVGVVELVAALMVAVVPRVGAYVVAAWLAGIITNLVIAGGSLDIALRDFGLLLGALALGQLSAVYSRWPRERPAVH